MVSQLPPLIFLFHLFQMCGNSSQNCWDWNYSQLSDKDGQIETVWICGKMMLTSPSPFVLTVPRDRPKLFISSLAASHQFFFTHPVCHIQSTSSVIPLLVSEQMEKD